MLQTFLVSSYLTHSLYSESHSYAYLMISMGYSFPFLEQSTFGVPGLAVGIAIVAVVTAALLYVNRNCNSCCRDCCTLVCQ